MHTVGYTVLYCCVFLRIECTVIRIQYLLNVKTVLCMWFCMLMECNALYESWFHFMIQSHGFSIPATRIFCQAAGCHLACHILFCQSLNLCTIYLMCVLWYRDVRLFREHVPCYIQSESEISFEVLWQHTTLCYTNYSIGFIFNYL